MFKEKVMKDNNKGLYIGYVSTVRIFLRMSLLLLTSHYQNKPTHPCSIYFLLISNNILSYQDEKINRLNE